VKTLLRAAMVAFAALLLAFGVAACGGGSSSSSSSGASAPGVTANSVLLGSTQPLTGVAARAARASQNFLETFPLFAALALAVVITHKNTPHTELGAELYLWARVAYLPVYLLGIPYLRTLVWTLSLIGMLHLLPPLLQ